MAAIEARVARARCVVFFDDEQKWFAGEVVSSRAVMNNPGQESRHPSLHMAAAAQRECTSYGSTMETRYEVGDLRLEELRLPRDGASRSRIMPRLRDTSGPLCFALRGLSQVHGRCAMAQEALDLKDKYDNACIMGLGDAFIEEAKAQARCSRLTSSRCCRIVIARIMQ